MYRNIWIGVILTGICWYNCSANKPESHLAFTHITADSVLLHIYEQHDQRGVLDGFYSHIITPVCEDKQCQEVHIDFYWDVLGNFKYFNWNKKKPLTKLDHTPFSEDDYAKLLSILRTTSPAFIHLRRDELTAAPLVGNDSDVDGLTGATVESVKKEMVAGASYTCYTLWHIAHGAMHFKIQEYTKSKLSGDLITKLLDSHEIEAHYFLLDNLRPQELLDFFDRFCDLAALQNPYFLNRFMQRFIWDDLSPKQVSSLFLLSTHMDNQSKLSLIEHLKKWKEVPTEDLDFLLKMMDDSSPEVNDGIIELIINQTEGADAEFLVSVFDFVSNNNVDLGKAGSHLLGSLDHSRVLKKRSRQFRRLQQEKVR